jgi:F-type H+-transporting ATPase subunit b
MTPLKTTLVLLAGGGHKPAPLVDLDGTIFVQFGIFIVLLFILTKLVFRPYLALLKERSANIDGAKEEAQRMSTAADADLASYEDQVLKARKDAANVRTALRGEGEQQATAVMAEAREQAEQRVTAAREKIQKSAAAAQLSLRAKVDRVAQEIAAKLLGREV